MSADNRTYAIRKLRLLLRGKGRFVYRSIFSEKETILHKESFRPTGQTGPLFCHIEAFWDSSRSSRFREKSINLTFLAENANFCHFCPKYVSADNRTYAIRKLFETAPTWQREICLDFRSSPFPKRRRGNLGQLSIFRPNYVSDHYDSYAI